MVFEHFLTLLKTRKSQDSFMLRIHVSYEEGKTVRIKLVYIALKPSKEPRQGFLLVAFYISCH